MAEFDLATKQRISNQITKTSIHSPLCHHYRPTNKINFLIKIKQFKDILESNI